MTQPHQFLGFIGAGKLAGSVMRGLIRAKFCGPAGIIAAEPIEEARRAFGAETGVAVSGSNREVAESADVILIAVKPGVVLEVIREVSSLIEGKCVISLAAGVRLESMEKLARARFMRAMTNTPSTVCQAATAVAPGARTTEDDLKFVRHMFESLGTVVDVRDEHIDAVTALAGSGPAFVYTVIEALAQGGEKVGLPGAVAHTLATQTVLGAAALALESGLSPDELRRMVVTPGGTTAAGLAAMEKQGTAQGLIDAVEAATKRGAEMATETAKTV